MDDLVRWLGEQLDEDERIARAAGGRSEQVWQADLSGVDPIGGKSWPLVVRYVTGDQLRGAVAHLPVMQERSEDRMAHIAEWDPARVLREIDGKRQLLADILAEPHASVKPGGSTEIYCAADSGELCDCGRDARVARQLRLLVLPFEDRPGYAGAVASVE